MNLSFQGMRGIFHNWLPWKSDAEWCKGECSWLNEECVQDNSLKRWMYGETKEFIWPTFSEFEPVFRALFRLLLDLSLLFVISMLLSIFAEELVFGRKLGSYQISSGEQSFFFNNNLNTARPVEFK